MAVDECFFHAIAVYLPIITSDHAPILLQMSPKNKSGIMFKYEAFWDDNAECEEIVRKGWELDVEMENGWENVLARVKKCKANLQNWHKRTFKRADEEIYKFQWQLSALTSQSSENIDRGEVKSLQKRIDEVWEREEKFWGQRSRLK